MMNDKEEEVVMDEKVQNPENTDSDKDNKESSGNPWGCGTIITMLVVSLCFNLCSVMKDLKDSHRSSSHYSSGWSDTYSMSEKDTTVNDSVKIDSIKIDSVIPAYNVTAE